MLFQTASFNFCHQDFHWSLLVMPERTEGFTPGQSDRYIPVGEKCDSVLQPSNPSPICPSVSGKERRISGLRGQRGFLVSSESTTVVYLSCWLFLPSLISRSGKGKSGAWWRRVLPLATYFWQSSQPIPFSTGIRLACYC